jgi:hypothetical protein
MKGGLDAGGCYLRVTAPRIPQMTLDLPTTFLNKLLYERAVLHVSCGASHTPAIIEARPITIWSG